MLSRGINFVKHVSANLVYLWRTSAPASVYMQYASTLARTIGIKAAYRTLEEDYRNTVKQGHFSNDWFTFRIPFWLHTFQKFDLPQKDLKVLEIGSWEGMSSRFILQSLPKAHLTCVDTWQGSGEHVGYDSLKHIEENFDLNTALYRDRLQKQRMPSLSYFASSPAEPTFDLIYVDGSHLSDDVIIDAVHAFARLKVGGILILDDYLWRDYAALDQNPALGINAFLKLKSEMFEYVLVNYQITLRKTRG